MKKLKAWRLHSQACFIKKAEKTCEGTANPEGVKWCHPYSTANQYGFWLYPPIDFEIYNKDKLSVNCLEQYTDEDLHTIKGLVRPNDNVDPDKWCSAGGRTKFTVGAVEENVIQIWTGLILKTPKDWGLLIRSPINFEKKPYHVMEAFLETDWLQYDIWINLVCDEKQEKITITKKDPIAHIIPVHKESVSDWDFSVEHINRKNEESNNVFKFWINYNKNKFEKGGEQYLSPDGSLRKDSTTYFRQRKQEAKKTSSGCPFNKFIGKLIK